MTLVAVSQRVDTVPDYGERRDALDQRWADLLLACGLTPLLVPNHLKAAKALLAEVSSGGVLLTGGGDLAVCGGDTPERDAVEGFLIAFALERDLPLLGVCRGMQAVQAHFGVSLEPVEGHVTPRQELAVNGQRIVVNSYHRFGAFASVPGLEVWARADDGVIEAVRHSDRRVQGIMWHPERLEPFRADDVALIGDFFNGGGTA